MKVEIKKQQDIVNDVPSEVRYTVYISRPSAVQYLNPRTDSLGNYSEEEMKELAQKLSDKFLTKI